MNLSDFLLQRIAEDEAVARLASSTIGDGCWWAADRSVRVPRATVAETVVPQHIARHDPARVLAQCEANRRIVDLHHARDTEILTADDEENVTLCVECALDFPCSTLRLLALPYADHEDFRDEWRP